MLTMEYCEIHMMIIL